MIFDQYSRYRACADLIRQTGFISGESVLDVGSGPDCLLGNFLPEAKIVFVDPLITEPMRRGRFQGTADDERLDRLRFDCVVAVDVLEHIPPGERARFLSRLATMAEDSLVIGFPAIEAGSAPETDQAINSLYRQTYDQDYPWLDEHQRFRLPSLGATVTSLTQEGWHCQTLGHGHAPWLSELLGLTICAWEIPKLKDLVLAISERFNRELYESDFRPPHYRHFIVATRQPIAPLIAPTALDYADRLFETIMNKARQQYFVESMKLLVGAEGSALRVEALVAERNDILARNELLLIEREVLVSQRDNAYDELSRIRQSKALRAAGFIWRQKWRMAHWLSKLRDPESLAVSLKLRFGQIFRRHQTLVRRVLARLQPPSPQTIQKITPKSDAPFLPPAIHPTPRSGSKSDYIMWGVIDWHFRHQRPQHLCRELAANQRRVLYISAALIDDHRAGFSVEPLDDGERLFQVRLFAEGAPSIYSVRPDRAIIEQLRSGVSELLKWADIGSAISIVHHPFWYEMAGAIPNSQLVYDCLDHHGGFDNTSPDILKLEQQLLRAADLTVTTSDHLDQLVAGVTPRRKLIRNAAEFEHFSTPPLRVFRDEQGRRVIGYIGAIAGWFDLELMATVAESFPDCLILLIGDDTVKAAARLGSLSNVRFVGDGLC
ncbi:MAG: hypothetical protein EBZ36_04620 [Acidobacteria bacterium]|nr:hypothetical protein [Acidobacteriota bacterium]